MKRLACLIALLFATPVYANTVYEFSGTCASCSSDAMSMTLTLHDSYVPGTALTEADLISAVYQDASPFTYSGFDYRDFWGKGVIGTMPVDSGFAAFHLGAGDADSRFDVGSGPAGWELWVGGLGPTYYDAWGSAGIWTRVDDPPTISTASAASIPEPSVLALLLMSFTVMCLVLHQAREETA